MKSLMFYKRLGLGIFAVLILFTLKAPYAHAAKPKATLLVSAASSTSAVMLELEKTFEKKYPDIDIQYNFGGSGTLQKQIENGAPVDIFVSASPLQMDALMKNGFIDPAYQKVLLKNRLVLIVPKDSNYRPRSISELTDKKIKFIALGETKTVPAGIYAKESLEYKKVYDKVSSKLVMTKDVSQVLGYVESGNADAGFVYKTDALSSSKVRTVLTIDSKAHSPITYPIGILSESKSPKQAKLFYDFLSEKEAQAVYRRFGFTQ